MSALSTASNHMDSDGFAILPGFLTDSDLEPARNEFHVQFPTADSYHDDTDERAARYRKGQFAGLDTFPFDSTELCLLTVQNRIIDLAEALLGDDDIRIYRGEIWAKYTGAVDYEQPHHRDFENHTILVPSSDQQFRQLEMFVYLSDVEVPDGAVRLVAREHEDAPESQLHELEIAATGPAGTVVAYWTDTLHRGAQLTRPRGARFSLHINFRPAACEWGTRSAWGNGAQNPAWGRFVERASPRQLELFGFPRPGHAFWTPETLAGMGRRYPGLDLSPWSA